MGPSGFQFSFITRIPPGSPNRVHRVRSASPMLSRIHGCYGLLCSLPRQSPMGFDWPRILACHCRDERSLRSCERDCGPTSFPSWKDLCHPAIHRWRTLRGQSNVRPSAMASRFSTLSRAKSPRRKVESETLDVRDTERIRHQTECSWNQTQTDRSATVAGIRVSGYRAGHGRSRSGVAGRSIGGAEPVGPDFYPDNGRMPHANQSSESLQRDASEAQLQRSDATQYLGVDSGRADSPRRQWSEGEKRRIVAESRRSGDSVSVVAQRNGVNASVLFMRRRQFPTICRCAGACTRPWAARSGERSCGVRPPCVSANRKRPRSMPSVFHNVCVDIGSRPLPTHRVPVVRHSATSACRQRPFDEDRR